MRQRPVATLAISSAALLLAACAVAPFTTSQKDPKAWESTRTMVAGDELDTVLVDDQLLEDAIREMEPGVTGDKRAMIAQVRAANNGTGGRGLSGLGGDLGHAFLDAAGDALKPGQGNIDKQERVTTTTHGKIIDYEYRPSPGDWMVGGGKLHVITMIETVKTKRNPTTPPPAQVRREAFKWEISVADGGFTVHQKQSGAQPFPGTFDFSIPMITRVNLLGFKYKLYARGTVITIDKVYYGGRDFDPAKWDDPSVWEEIPKTGGGDLKKYQGVYRVDADSCIDLLFVEYTWDDPNHPPIPLDIDELKKPPFYCLGRCDNPPIINTK